MLSKEMTNVNRKLFETRRSLNHARGMIDVIKWLRRGGTMDEIEKRAKSWIETHQILLQEYLDRRKALEIEEAEKEKTND